MEDPSDSAPSRRRRVVVTLVYLAVFLAAHGGATLGTVSSACLEANRCDGTERIWFSTLDVIRFGGFVTIVALGYLGRLWGARGAKQERGEPADT